MKLTILVDDNRLMDGLKTAKGFACILEDGHRRVLFDTGLHGEILENSKRLGVDLKNLDYIVFSHGHRDHIGGTMDILNLYKNETKKPKIIACGGFFSRRYRWLPLLTEIGANHLESYLGNNFEVILTNTPYKLTDNLTFLGKVERFFDFEGGPAVGKVKRSGKFVDDFIDDDSGMVLETKDGIVLLSGCAHSGLCNMVRYAKKISGNDNVIDIVGGTHLKKSSDDVIEKTGHTLLGLGVKKVHLCHCTGNAIHQLGNILDCETTGCGLVLEY